jgi:para-aminobenzoate synthetase component 1
LKSDTRTKEIRRRKRRQADVVALAGKDKTAEIAAESIRCKLHYKKTDKVVDLAALSEVFSSLESASIIGGNCAKADTDRFSYWAAAPKEIFEFRSGKENPFEKLQAALDKYKLEDNTEHRFPKGMFCGGWIGYFSYELGRYIEKLPVTTVDDLEMPLIRLCFYDKVICYDHIEGAWWLIALEMVDDKVKPEEKLVSLERLLNKAEVINIEPPCRGDIENVDISQIRCNMEKDYYLGAIEKIKLYIFDGDVYQINFSQRFECDYQAEPIKLFGWQNHYNPSGYAAYIDGGDFYIVSASPEMFITINDGIISTKPIKGTRPRLTETNPQEKEVNAKNLSELIGCEKEQAELNMIVDLERNDLVKICEFGTRKVIQQRTIESYPTVYHAVATVAGKLKEKVTFCDILKAMFPGGSITGAPKIRSMEIIDETEPTERGVYTGSIGYIGLDGRVCLNIAIRTIIIKNRKAYAQTGGGIVADSDPQAEWDETITKARALLAGIKAVQNPQ